MYDAHRSHLVAGHLDQMVSQFAARWVQTTSLDEDFLLLSDRSLKRLRPSDDIPMTYCQLVCTTNRNQLAQRFLILLVGELERQFFHLQLPFEQIHGVLKAWLWDSMEWDIELVDCYYFV